MYGIHTYIDPWNHKGKIEKTTQQESDGVVPHQDTITGKTELDTLGTQIVVGYSLWSRSMEQKSFLLVLKCIEIIPFW